MTGKKHNYDEDKIKSLSSLEHIRKRSGMYIGRVGDGADYDRTGGYVNCANEFFNYIKKKRLKTKLIFINDGPGLLIGSMWNDYAALEKSWQGKIMVLTLRMVTERITKEWLNV